MIVTSALLAAVISAIAAGFILWANPARNVNRAVAACALHLGLWLAVLHCAFTLEPGLPWLRLTCAVGAWLPLQFWMVRQAIVKPPGEYSRRWLRRHAGWIAICAGLTYVCFTGFFIPAHSTATHRLYGPGYYGFIIANLGLFAFLLQDAWVGTRRLTGARRLELQVWLLGGCAVATAILALMVASAVTHDRGYVRLQPFVVLVFYCGTAYVITTHRILDGRQVLLAAARSGVLVGVVAGVAFGLDRALTSVLPEWAALLVTTTGMLLLAARLHGWLNRVLHVYPQAAAARQAAFEIARRERARERLEPAYLDLLRGWAQSDRVLLLVRDKTVLAGDDGNAAAVRALERLRWATPERLARQRRTPEHDALVRLLEERQLGVLALAEGPTLTTLVGAGVPASRRPYTYPQAANLLELAAIITSALERAHFSLKAQHAEQLATAGLIGAGLAHEIRNPLVTIKTFVQLLPTHYHDAAFREKFTGLIADEVTRIDQLTEQLLELASPRAYSPQDIELHAVLQSGLELVATRARNRGVEVRSDFRATPDRVRADAAAVRQVLLNLCLNALQAVDGCATSRWIRVSTRRLPQGIEFAVEDNGPGVPAEIRPQVFEPFRSTKSAGFGLGLAVCSDIVGRLGGAISLDQAERGRGATFRVVLPAAEETPAGRDALTARPLPADEEAAARNSGS